MSASVSRDEDITESNNTSCLPDVHAVVSGRMSDPTLAADTRLLPRTEDWPILHSRYSTSPNRRSGYAHDS